MTNRWTGGEARALRTFSILAAAVALALVGCGGGGGGDGGAASPAPADGGSVPAIVPSASVADRCVAPRAGTNPDTGLPFADAAGTLDDEKTWVRSWIDETYLWYSEVPTTLQSAAYATPVAYFADLKTPALMPSGRAKDRFHYTYDTAQYRSILQSTESGYGVEFAYLARTPPRQIRVAYTEPGSPAAQAGLVRGMTLLAIDGIDAVNAGSQTDVDRLNAALAPSANGQAHAFQRRAADGSVATVNLTSASVLRSPVQAVRTLPTPTGNVGYLQFNDHVEKAEVQLVDAVNQLQAAGIADLVLDMRYNGGGLLAVASELATMVAPAASTQGAAFERLVFNAKNPFHLSASQSTLPFYATGRGLSVTAGQALPRLNLPRVTVLTGPDTCSASESVVNGLRGVGVTVHLIGGATCGKPYGFYPEDNCGTTYFAIQFQGVNAQGFGDYGDGLVPTCTVADDFDHALGDAAEARLAAALQYRSSGTCPTAPSSKSLSAGLQKAEGAGTPYLNRSALRTSRIVRPVDLPN
ncbi:S41 family peptidase [Variovorax arabinosiphilus]|uniref:S41 family peptidase n=1 Tax=Variovorax arabinosiphilus TaxID=3053498 RepID=UPI002578E6D2|nr:MULTISPECIES: S41 family peptidase [unclassified Variovorax]MDM0121390.1 S41 family peptidase [Variovorax sp. J2L1-78]MDM0130451.1 S41 family peptidase [Variovorax sp. J2L1-63]MDM0234153.1 S41 family peptidase [Variovorax sp. J2R1-6]